MEDVRKGYRLVPNPFNAAHVRRVPLSPEEVDAIVFWTRDPRPLLGHIDELEGRGLAFYIQVTLTAYPSALEARAPSPRDVLGAVESLARRLGPRSLVWRYDPIVIASPLLAEGSRPLLDTDFHIKNFSALAADFSGMAERVILSLLDEYRGTTKRLEAAGYREPVYGSQRRAPREERASPAASPGGPPPEPYPAILSAMATAATGAGLTPKACAEAWDLSPYGIGKASCVDAELVSLIAGKALSPGRDKGQRPGCGCAASVDVGAYGRCPTGCAYCYARR